MTSCYVGRSLETPVVDDDLTSSVRSSLNRECSGCWAIWGGQLHRMQDASVSRGFLHDPEPRS